MNPIVANEPMSTLASFRKNVSPSTTPSECSSYQGSSSDNISFKESLISLVPKGINNIEDLTVGYHCSVIFSGNSVLNSQLSETSSLTSLRQKNNNNRYIKTTEVVHDGAIYSSTFASVHEDQSEKLTEKNLKKLDYYHKSIYLPSSKTRTQDKDSLDDFTNGNWLLLWL
jgi:hypothetical protein